MEKIKKYFAKIPYLKKIYNILYNPATGDSIRFIVEKPIMFSFIGNDLGKVLENGCGGGRLYTRYLAENSQHLIASDILKERIRSAKMIAGGRENVSFIVADAQNLPFEDSYFDTIVCTQVLEHLKNDNLAVSEMSRLLKENGYLILSVPVPPDPFENEEIDSDSVDAHKRAGYTYKQIKKLLYNNCLEIVEYQYCFLIFSRFAFRLIHWFDKKLKIRPPAMIIVLLSWLDKLLPPTEEFNPYGLVLKARKKGENLEIKL